MALPLRVRPATRSLPASEVFVAFSDGKTFDLPAAALRVVRPHLARAGFRGEAHEAHAVPLPGPRRRVIFVVGTGETLTTNVLRRGSAAGVQYAKREGLRSIAVQAPRSTAVAAPDGVTESARAIAEGILLANYRFTAYKADAEKREQTYRLTGVDILVERSAVPETLHGVRQAQLETEATILARNLVNEPSSRVTPQALVSQARAIAQASGGRVTLTVFNRRQCEARGMGAFLAVAKGSAEEPAFIHLVYRADGEKEERRKKKGRAGESLRRVVLIGKGITFDSGGLSLKPAEGMETMKIDMAGAAAVLGTFSVLARLRPAIEVHGMIAACENMPSGAAVKPGDIVRAQSGKTVEILNTDAEGRLTLADALGEAQKVQPDAIIDLATLTGACMVALGDDIGGLWSNNDELAGAVTAAAEAAGEPLWRMPLFADYRERLKSEMADLKNITGRKYGGAITAALFLKEFVGDTPWAHLDIAGPSYAEKPVNPVLPVGGTGYGARTLLRYLASLGK